MAVGLGVGVVWLHHDAKVHTLICNLLVIFAVIHFSRVDVYLTCCICTRNMERTKTQLCLHVNTSFSMHNTGLC